VLADSVQNCGHPQQRTPSKPEDEKGLGGSQPRLHAVAWRVSPSPDRQYAYVRQHGHGTRVSRCLFFPRTGAAAPFGNVMFLFTSWSPRPQRKFDILSLIQTIHRTPTLRYNICAIRSRFGYHTVDYTPETVMEALRQHTMTVSRERSLRTSFGTTFAERLSDLFV
jgi:hypothetical protein